MAQAGGAAEGRDGTGMARRGLLGAAVRRLPIAAGLGLLDPRSARAQAGPVRFRILREGSAIGIHEVTLEAAPGGGRAARSAIDVLVRFAGVVVYRYRHRFGETWSAEGRLLAIASRMERNGVATVLDGRAEADGFLLSGPEGTVRLPAEVAPLTWWDPAIFRRPLLFDPRAGRTLRRLRVERRDLPGGGFTLRVSGDDEGVATYDAQGRWAAHAMKGEDGSAVTYERIG